MASLQVSGMAVSGSSSSCCSQKSLVRATINGPKIRIGPLSLPRLSSKDFIEELSIRSGGYGIPITTQMEKGTGPMTSSSDPVVVAKLYAIMEAVADRIEMHKNIGEQRDNWNHLLLSSIHAMTLTAATMCGLAAASASGEPLAGLKVSSTILYLAATGVLAIMNKIQPSQLAEEQRNAARLFKQLHGQIQTLLSVGSPTSPQFGGLNKGENKRKGFGKKIEGNGWNRELEDEMREIVGVLKRKDKADYLRLSEKALKAHKVLAFSGPLLTGLGALGSAFVGATNPWAVILGVAGGALASVVNAVEHGGQVGMIFEMYRSNAGFFKLMEESIESNINETNVWGRENGQVYEMKVALQLGRSLSDLRILAASSSLRNIEEDTEEEFGSKLF
nr:probable F-box protein At4g22030 [Populus alba]